MTEFERRALQTFAELEATLRVVRTEINALNSALAASPPPHVARFSPPPERRNSVNEWRLATLRAE